MGIAVGLSVAALLITVAAVIPLSIYTARALEDNNSNSATVSPGEETVNSLEPVSNNSGSIGTAAKAFAEGFFMDMDVKGTLKYSGGTDGQLLQVDSEGDVGFVDLPVASIPEWARFVLDDEFGLGATVTLTYQMRTNQWFTTNDFFVNDTGNTLTGASITTAGVVTVPPGSYRFLINYQTVVTQPSNSQQKIITTFEPFPIVNPAVDPTSNFLQMYNITGTLAPVGGTLEGFFTATETDNTFATTMMNTSSFAGGGGETAAASVAARQYNLFLVKLA